MVTITLNKGLIKFDSHIMKKSECRRKQVIGYGKDKN